MNDNVHQLHDPKPIFIDRAEPRWSRLKSTLRACRKALFYTVCAALVFLGGIFALLLAITYI
ncbi:hypothetical protein [Sneathiella sp.]|uniref:hypothetical protein n=1 Tax=Sneathiella sp. TaxID=1964365 RepID=UPI002FE162B3